MDGQFETIEFFNIGDETKVVFIEYFLVDDFPVVAKHKLKDVYFSLVLLVVVIFRNGDDFFEGDFGLLLLRDHLALLGFRL